MKDLYDRQYYLKTEWETSIQAKWSLSTQYELSQNPYIFELSNHNIIDIMNDKLEHISLDCESKYWMCKEWMRLKHIRLYDLMEHLSNKLSKEIQEEIEILSKMRLLVSQESSRPFSIFNWFKSTGNRIFG